LLESRGSYSTAFALKPPDAGKLLPARPVKVSSLLAEGGDYLFQNVFDWTVRAPSYADLRDCEHLRTSVWITEEVVIIDDLVDC
jgi:hypothetical protein